MSRLRVAAFPRPAGDNPYGRLLDEALAHEDVEVVDAPALDPRALATAGVDAIHLHWLEYLYRAEGPPGARGVRAHKRAAGLLRALRAARESDVRVVWTVHNLRPHEARYPWLDRLVAAEAGRCADALVVHSAHAAARVRKHLDPPGPVTVLPHPNYLGAYPPAAYGRAQERARLGVPGDAYVYLVFGQLRRYKRVPEVVAAFRASAGDDKRLVVAGAVLEDEVRAGIERARAGDPRVVLLLSAVPEAEVAGLHAAADAAVLHYEDVFSSGALLLALSFGLPVAGPRGTALTELCRDAAVVAYDPGGLAGALAELHAGNPRERRAAALASAKSYTWDAYARGLAELFRGAATPTSMPEAAVT
jgi:glycosyltransferase involved in cell wall biosynthesis